MRIFVDESGTFVTRPDDASVGEDARPRGGFLTRRPRRWRKYSGCPEPAICQAVVQI